MQITCPNCQASMNAKPAKPGQYTPTCPKCNGQFRLVVPDDPDQAPEVKPLGKPLRPTVPFPPPKRAADGGDGARHG